MGRLAPFLVAALLAAAALFGVESGPGEGRLAKRSGQDCAAAVCALAIF